MNKSYLVVGAVVIVVLLGVYLMKPQKSTQMTKPSAEQSATTTQPTSGETGTMMKKAAAVIKYTDNGFVPKSVTIKKGETVEWDNETTDSMWVASSPHPQHTDYPGFDQLKGAGKGESYSFTFDKAGNWKYHNHLDPKDYGVVIVQE